jgi:ATP-dependent helicase HrpA
MNFLLIDDAGKVIARSRSLAALRNRHAATAQQEFAKQSELTTGARTWVFGDLPEKQDAAPGARKQLGYPALVDEGGSVGLRVFATPPEARTSHERGTARLIRLVMARDLKPLRRDLAVNVQGEMVYKSLGPHPLLNPDLVAGRDLRDDLLDRIVMTVFLDGRPPLRSAAAFDARITTQRGRHRPAGAGNIAHRADHAGAARPHTDGVGEGRSARGRRHPRATRLAHAGGFPAGHALGATQGVSALPAGHRAAARKAGARCATRRKACVRDRAARGALPRTRQGGAWALPPGDDDFRWLLEELRVSLYAQQLKTRVPVSARRLEDAWADRQKSALVEAASRRAAYAPSE